MKLITKIATIMTLVSGISIAHAEDVKKEIKNVPPKPEAQNVLFLGLPINNSGISFVGRPDRLNFVTVKSDNTVEIDWKNVCELTKQHPFNIQDLQKLNGNPEDYILPYALTAANPEHKC